MNRKVGIAGIALLAIVGIAVYAATANPFQGYGMMGYGGYRMPMMGHMVYGGMPMMGYSYPMYQGYGFPQYLNITDNNSVPNYPPQQYPPPQPYHGHCPMMGW